MTEQEFERLLLLYGPDIAAWPSSLSGAARRFIEQNAPAHVLVSELEALQADLDEVLSVDGDLRVLAITKRHRGLRRPWWVVLPAGAAAAVLVLGLFMGNAAAVGHAQSDALLIGIATGQAGMGGLL